MGTPIYGPQVLSAKNVSSIHIWELYIYGQLFPIYDFFYMDKNLTHIPLFHIWVQICEPFLHKFTILEFFYYFSYLYI